MTGRRAAAVGAVVSLVLVLGAGCGSGDEPGAAKASATGSPQATSTSTPSPAALTLRAVQRSLEADRGLRVRVAKPSLPGSGSTVADADLTSGNFRARVDLGVGNGVLEMLRIADTAWTKAPVPVWVGMGFTRESARRAEGKWVVGPVEGIRSLVSSLDPTSTIQKLIGLPAEAALSRRTVTSGPMKGQRVLMVRFQEGATAKVFSTPAPNVELTRIQIGNGRARTDFVVLDHHDVVVSVPDAADVLQPAASGANKGE